jgi:hypothetical protein
MTRQTHATRARAGKRHRSDRSRWSARVTTHSNALDLEPGVFTWHDPHRIAASLKRSAEQSTRRKTTPFQSAMSMLTFYINRAGRSLSADQRRVLERAKVELRREFGRL